MGVLGLYSYFESKSLGQRKSWSSSSTSSSSFSAIPHAPTPSTVDHDNVLSKTRYFILDGNAYIHHLYCGQFEWIWGGQYSGFVNLLTAHIAALEACGFRLQFLFDGPLPLQKLQTRLNRDTEKIHKMTRVMGDLEHYHVLGLNGSAHEGLELMSGGGATRTPGNTGAGGGGGGGNRSSSQFLIPPLVMEVTLQTLRSLGIEMMVCDGEADGLVAQLAMEKSMESGVEEAYAVSKDSDYFIYNTGLAENGGYIPLDSLFVAKDPKTLVITISATVYSQAAVAEHLGIRPMFLPLFASLAGNDYLRPEAFEDQIARSLADSTGQKLSASSNTNHARIRATATFLREYGAGNKMSDSKNSDDELAQVMERILDDRKALYSSETDQKRQELRSSLEESIDQYTPVIPDDFSNQDSISSRSPRSIESSETPSAASSLVTSPNPSTPTSRDTSSTQVSIGSAAGLFRIKEAFRSGQFSFKLMDVVCSKMFWCTPFLEDTDRESAWLVSRELRRWVYGILSRNTRASVTDDEALEVVEYVRRGDHLSAETVTAASKMELREIVKRGTIAEPMDVDKNSRRISVMDIDTNDIAAAASTQGQQEQDVNPADDMDLASRTSLFLAILGSDTERIRALPKQFMVLAATLRYMIEALAHSRTRSSSYSIANFEVIAFVASVLFLREKYHPESIPTFTNTAISSTPSSSTGTHAAIIPPTPAHIAASGSPFSTTEAPPMTKRSLHLSTQFQHVLGGVSLLANALHLEDMIPSLASLFDGLLFQQSLALARGGTLLEQRMQFPDSVQMYHGILAAVEEGFIDSGEIDVVVVFRSKKQTVGDMTPLTPLGIFGPDMEPINALPLTSTSSSSSAGSLKSGKSSSGIHKKSSSSKKKNSNSRSGSSRSTGAGGSSSSSSASGSGGGSNGANMFNVLSLGCEF
ncbi:Protein asteroid 1 [Gryganskiella cystojenkinii]|nr:Protein asteroid 1 [Gryganskiella cystojenkinii]